MELPILVRVVGQTGPMALGPAPIPAGRVGPVSVLLPFLFDFILYSLMTFGMHSCYYHDNLVKTYFALTMINHNTLPFNQNYLVGFIVFYICSSM